jgi:hypothetical protein
MAALDVSAVTARVAHRCTAHGDPRITRGMRWSLVAAVAASAGCDSLLPPGDPGFAEFGVPVLLDDVPTDGVVAATWATPDGPVFAVCALEAASPTTTLALVYDPPPFEAIVNGVSRLDFYFGAVDDLRADYNSAPVRERVARTRSTVWRVESVDDIDALPFAVEGLADELELDVADVYVLETSDPGARECGDIAYGTCPSGFDCDVLTGVGTADCCAEAAQQFRACGTVVAALDADGRQARLRRGL